jgi:hypothetical protein
MALTYCNPLPLPDYPRGYGSRNKKAGDKWPHKVRRDFRETADPTVVYFEGKWYLYPSCGMAYVSEDFVNWTYHPIPDAGYAPTVLYYRKKFYLTACGAPLLVSDSPLGPFKAIGPMLLPDGKPVTPWNDPMLFADDDGKMYAYWGLGAPGIFGARLDPEKPNQLLTEPKILFSFNPGHEWERYGDFNEDTKLSYVEGPWMFKYGKTFYLTYAAPGTEFKTYGMGCYVSKKPLGPFKYQKLNPILRDSHGLVHGPGHGCIVRGPNGTIWAFYTCLVRNHYLFERRIGMDPAGIDSKANLFVSGASETPQWAPGTVKKPQKKNDAGLIPVTVNRPVAMSSEKYGREAAYAIDNNVRTWWEPEDSDQSPWMEVDLQGKFTVSAVRILWQEPGLDYDNGAVPGPFKYRIEVDRGDKSENSPWKTVLDRTLNTVDMLIDYRTFAPAAARRVKLIVTGWPKAVGVGVIEFTVFGRS